MRSWQWKTDSLSSLKVENVTIGTTTNENYGDKLESTKKRTSFTSAAQPHSFCGAPVDSSQLRQKQNVNNATNTEQIGKHYHCPKKERASQQA